MALQKRRGMAALRRLTRRNQQWGMYEATDVCPNCGGDAADNWFDRSLCECTPGGTMHTYCANCGFALDDCGFEEDE